jgi:hypothetical protein
MSKRVYDYIEVEVPLLGMRVVVFLSSYSKLKNWAEEKFGVKLEDLEPDQEEADGLTIDLNDYGMDGYVIVTLKDIKKKLRSWKSFSRGVGVIVHECLHATKAVLMSRGVPFTPENDEIIAYTQEHLVESMLSALTKGRAVK